MRWQRWLPLGLAVAIGIQLVPYGRAHTNPPVVREPAWDSASTRELFFRACKDCHSHETEWPWYSHVAPASWLVQYDVDEARSHFDVSDWGREHNEGDEAAEMVREGEMPLWYYAIAHREARLSDAERDALLAGLVATFGDEETEAEPHTHDE